MYRPDAALIIQADGSILAEVRAPTYAEARDQLARFAELVKSPEHVHTSAPVLLQKPSSRSAAIASFFRLGDALPVPSARTRSTRSIG